MNALRIGQVLPGVALLCLFFTSCGQNGSMSHDEAYYSTADSVAYVYDPKTAPIPEDRMLARKAEMNFKVKELQKTSQKITAITAHFGGEIWNSNLNTEIQNTVTKQISADSLLEVITHRQTNELFIRVPSQNLDSLLTALEGLSQLLHHKETSTENVTLSYLSNELKAKNMARTQERHENAIDEKKADIEQHTDATLTNLDIQNGVIDKQIANKAMLDRVQFSTVKVSIYQDAEAYQHVIANLHPDHFGPNLGAASVLALHDGWEFMQGIILFLIRIWPLYLLVTGIFFLIRYADRFRPKLAKVETEK